MEKIHERIRVIEFRIQRWFAVSSTALVCILAFIGVELAEVPDYARNALQKEINQSFLDRPDLSTMLAIYSGSQLETRTEEIKFDQHPRWSEGEIKLAKNEVVLSVGYDVEDKNLKEGFHVLTLFADNKNLNIRYKILAPVGDDLPRFYVKYNVISHIPGAPSLYNESSEKKIKMRVWIAFGIACFVAVGQFVWFFIQKN